MTSSRRSGRKPQPSAEEDLLGSFIRRLEGVDDNIVSEKEFFDFVRSWATANSSSDFPILDPGFPQSIQRRQALMLVDALTLDNYLDLSKTVWEVEQSERRWAEEDAKEIGLSVERSSEAFDVEAAREEWADWRAHMLNKYKLHGLVVAESREIHPSRFEEPRGCRLIWNSVPDLEGR